MDESVKNILASWDFSEYCNTFEENGIDMEALSLLDAETVKELIPKVGPRLKFLAKLKDYQCGSGNGMNTDGKVATIPEASSDSSASLTSTLTASSPLSDLEENIDPDDSVDDLGPAAANTTIFPLLDIDRNISTTTEHFIIPLTLDVLKQEFEIFLKSSSEWSIIQKNINNINEYTRGKICKVALDFLVPRYPLKKIPHVAFTDLAQVISKIFPTESPQIYFTPYKPENEASPALLAGGKLFSKYNNYKRLIATVDSDICHRKNNKKLKKPNPEGASCNTEDSTNEEDIANEFLKHNVGPENDLISYWDASFKLRKRLLNQTNIHSYFNTYRALQQPFGYNLILQDFERIHPSASNEIYNSWSKLSEAILILAVRKNLISEDFYNNCNKEINAIKYLPQLFTTATVRQITGKKYWRPSKAEMQESFLLQINNIGLLEEKIETRKQSLLAKNETLQPFMVLVEDGRGHCTSYMVINDTLYTLESALKCLDVCFKTFFVLDCKYPVECQQVWTFIQTFIYKIEAEKRFAGLNVITNEINNILHEKPGQ